MSRHIGSDFDRFLAEENLLDLAESLAARRVLVFKLRQMMREQGLDAMQLAERLDLEGAALQRLLGAGAEEKTDLLFLAKVAERLSTGLEEKNQHLLQNLADRLKEIYLRS